MRVGLAILTLLACVSAVAAAAPESATFVMDRVVVASGSSRTASATWVTSVVVGQAGPVRTSSFCNLGSLNGLGFWSILGARAAPVVLTAAWLPIGQGRVDLAWSGSADGFDVYRAFAPQNLVDPFNLWASPADCDENDSTPGQSQIIFYRVEPQP